MEQFVREFKSRNSNEHVEMLDVDSRDGSATASLYDILQYPAIVVTQQDGVVQKIWTGDQFPLIDEVASYARQ